MSTAIVVRFYFDPPGPAPDVLLGRLARTFAAWPHAWGTFHGVTGATGDRHTTTTLRDGAGELDSAGVAAAVAGHGGPSRMLSTTSSFLCWRFTSGVPSAGSVPVTLEAWGDEWTLRHHEDRAIGGQAALWIGDVAPFRAIADDAAGARPADVNARIEENLQSLTGLVVRLIEAAAPRSLKLFTDAGLYLPFNAHLVYLRDESVVLDDLALIDRVWKQGLPRHNVAPLGGHRSPQDLAFALHGWRSPEQRARLAARVEAQLPVRLAEGAAGVRRALASGLYDALAMPVGTTVLELPHFMNELLDRFYLDGPEGT